MDFIEGIRDEQSSRAHSLKMFLETTVGDDETVALALKNKHFDFTAADLSFLADMLYKENPHDPLLKKIKKIGKIVTAIGREED